MLDLELSRFCIEDFPLLDDGLSENLQRFAIGCQIVPGSGKRPMFGLELTAFFLNGGAFDFQPTPLFSKREITAVDFRLLLV